MNVSKSRGVEREAIEFIERFRASPTSRRPEARSEGAALASRLRTRASDLCHNKATEFSSEIGRLFELAAKVALLAHWPDEEALAQYEQDVAHVYGNHPRSIERARNYERFRREYVKSRETLD